MPSFIHLKVAYFPQILDISSNSPVTKISMCVCVNAYVCVCAGVCYAFPKSVLLNMSARNGNCNLYALAN